MSGLLNKVKDAVSGDKHHNDGTHGTHSTTTTGTHGTTTGTHGSGVTGSHGTTGTTGTSGLGTIGTTGVGSAAYDSGRTGPAPGTDGPHSSNLANKVDPRVDSDRDHSHNMGANPHGTAQTGTTGGYSTGTTGTTGTSGLTGSHGTHGTTGTSGLTGAHGTTGTHGTSGLGTTGTTGVGAAGYDSGRVGPGNDGPHSSNLANKADPRVDSDRDHSRNLGANPHGTAQTGTTGGYSTGTTGSSGLTGSHGTHSTTGTTTGSGLTGSSGTGPVGGALSGTHATGPAPNTAGPHKSDALNKADPRVDSNLDGSKTVGGNKTFTSDTQGLNKDPTDATQVPPSVLQQHVPGPGPTSGSADRV